MNVYASLAYTDSQYKQVTPRLPVLPCLHGSFVLDDGGRTTHRKLRSATHLATLIDRDYANQLSRKYDGLLCIDYEPFNGKDGPGRNPITVEETEQLLIEAVVLVKQVLPNAKLSIWGVPTSNVYVGDDQTKDIDHLDLARLWEVVDWVAPHDYTRAVHFSGSQRYLSASRIADAAATGLPVIPFICPRQQPAGDKWIPQDALMARALQAKRLGCEGIVYWDGVADTPDQQIRWDSDAWQLLDL